MQNSADKLEQRVACLESENRWLKRAIIFTASMAVMILGGGAVLMAPGEVVTSNLVLVDKEGKVRATLATMANGCPVFTLRHSDGKRGVLLTQGADGMPSLAFLDREQKIRLSLGLEPDGLTSLAMLDQNGEQRLSLFREGDGAAGLELTDEKKTRLKLQTGIDGNPALAFFDKDTVRMGMRIDEEGNPGLEIYDKRVPRISLGLFEKNAARFYLQGRGDQGGIRAQASSDGTSVLQISDKDGKVQFLSPKPE